jgi:hypothetical protein
LTEMIGLTCSVVWASETYGLAANGFEFNGGHRYPYVQCQSGGAQALPVRAGSASATGIGVSVYHDANDQALPMRPITAVPVS